MLLNLAFKSAEILITALQLLWNKILLRSYENTSVQSFNINFIIVCHCIQICTIRSDDNVVRNIRLYAGMAYVSVTDYYIINPNSRLRCRPSCNITLSERIKYQKAEKIIQQCSKWSILKGPIFFFKLDRIFCWLC